MKIFCSESGKWSEELEVLCPMELNTGAWKKDFAVAYNGILHWLDGYNEIVVAYNPFNNEVRIIELPDDAISPIFRHLGLCGGSLQIFEFFNDV